MASFEEFLASHGISLEDRTSKGGATWALTGEADPTVNDRLRAEGFRYRPTVAGGKTVPLRSTAPSSIRLY
jgi:hypothetical protein